jgi:hypothetical protein
MFELKIGQKLLLSNYCGINIYIISLYLIVTKYGTTITLMEGGQYINWREAEHANFVY